MVFYSIDKNEKKNEICSEIKYSTTSTNIINSNNDNNDDYNNNNKKKNNDNDNNDNKSCYLSPKQVFLPINEGSLIC